MQSSSSAEANGSRVPVCPVRRTPSARRASATTSWDDGPSGLSTGSTPACASAVIAARRLIIARTRSTGTRSRVPARPHLPEELLDPHGVLQRTVELEAQLRDSSDAKALAQLSANEREIGRAACR